MGEISKDNAQSMMQGTNPLGFPIREWVNGLRLYRRLTLGTQGWHNCLVSKTDKTFSELVSLSVKTEIVLLDLWSTLTFSLWMFLL